MGGATTDGSTHLAYNSDGSSFYGYMTHLPAADHADGALREVIEFGTGIFMGSIPEAPHTYNVIGNMNEYQLSIGETTFDGVEALHEQPGAIIDYYSLMWLTLQRARTAREAIATMDQLTREHGYASTGETFSITDPEEAWVMDFIGRGADELGAVWVARRVPDGHVCAHANHARITTYPRDSNDTLYSQDNVEFAKRKGLYPEDGTDEAFSFSDVFDPLTPYTALMCEARVWDMFRQVAADSAFETQYLDYAQGRNLGNRMPLFVKARPLELNDTMWLMRSHYEGSWFDARNDAGGSPFHSPYRARPLGFEVSGQKYALNRNVGYLGTFYHCVSHARGSMPGPACAGGVTWFGIDDASTSVRAPMYACTNAAPETFAFGNGDTDRYERRAAWAFNTVANFAYSRWNLIGTDVQSKVIDTEKRLFKEVASLDAEVAVGVNNAKSAETIAAELSDYSISTANSIVDAWVDYFPSLMVRYRDFLEVSAPAPPPVGPKDGPARPDIKSPGYDDEWYANLVEATGDRYRVPSAEDSNLEAHACRKAQLLERMNVIRRVIV